MRKKNLLLICLGVLLLLAANAYANTLEIDWWAIGPSSKIMNTGNVQLTGMVGQAAAGELDSGISDLCVGYLCLPSLQLSLYLPLIQK